jgi:hypothetical protein
MIDRDGIKAGETRARQDRTAVAQGELPCTELGSVSSKSVLIFSALSTSSFVWKRISDKDDDIVERGRDHVDTQLHDILVIAGV